MPLKTALSEHCHQSGYNSRQALPKKLNSEKHPITKNGASPETAQRRASMSYKEDLREFTEILQKIESPGAGFGTINLEVYKPEIMPVTLEDILDIEKILEPRSRYSEPSRSYNRNWYNLMTSVIMANATDATTFGDGHINMKNDTGVLFWCSWKSYAATGGFRDDNITFIYGSTTVEGIRVGTGNSAEDFDGYEMDVKIEHGDGPDELRYYEQFVPLREWDAATRKWAFTETRFFANHSGGDVVVAEVGRFWDVKIHATYTEAMVSRELVNPPVTVANEELLRVKYVLETSAFPS